MSKKDSATIVGIATRENPLEFLAALDRDQGG
jgi:hypothetical protein